MPVVTVNDAVEFLLLKPTQEEMETFTIPVMKLLLQHQGADESSPRRLLKRDLVSLVL